MNNHPISDISSSSGIFRALVGIFTLICLWPLWTERFPPMQDYPQHLSQAYIMSEQGKPDNGFEENFLVNDNPGPYMTFYFLTGLFLKILPVEAAGRITLSLYILLIALIILKNRPNTKERYLPWGMLILFPFAFNQQYFLGNVNYLFSLPILILALKDNETLINNRPSRTVFARHLVWQAALFLTHPMTFLVYIGFSLLLAVTAIIADSRRWTAFLPPFSAFLIFISWYALSTSSSTGDTFTWLPVKMSAIYYGYMFTGMRWLDGVDYVTAALWLSVLFITLISFLNYRDGHKLPYLFIICWLFSLIAVFALPFSKGVYTNINLRVSAISYFFAAMAAGQIRIKGIFLYIYLIIVTGLLILSVEKQLTISREIDEIAPVIDKMKPDSRILPLVFDNDSMATDRYSFDIHVHDYFYYHVTGGRGFSPYFPKALINPVHYKKSAERPAPGEYEPRLFNWETHAADYRYFLFRGGPKEEIINYMSEHAAKIKETENWLLFERK